MIKAKIIGADETVRRIRQIAPRVSTGLDRKIKQLTLRLLRSVKSSKLSGQVLNVRTGRLRRSINYSLSGVGSSTVTGTVGTNVVYARAHEHGFDGIVPVKEHLRMQTMAFGKSIIPTQVTVKAHPMHMRVPEKSFLRSALADMRPEILEEIKKAVEQGVKA